MSKLNQTFYFRERKTGHFYVECRPRFKGHPEMYYRLTRVDDYGKHEWEHSHSAILRWYDVIPAAEVHSKGLLLQEPTGIPVQESTDLTDPASPVSEKSPAAEPEPERTPSDRAVELVGNHMTACIEWATRPSVPTAIADQARALLLKYIAELEAGAEKPTTPPKEEEFYPPLALREIITGHVRTTEDILRAVTRTQYRTSAWGWRFLPTVVDEEK